ncbi:signal peptidase I [Cyanobium sp. Morenito 9A2]|uniref:signal peptidase I n=1 Tax=Cyanobium sp. Morenito 9A2 TaxID=2823718 RepID=UPI0020CCD97B|nr:signal peptidase I [Cyanobium sp. Morenito 9A2]MCP9849409.1 signal peptidase I [Cyanobium sp. Morenito 9A2]
MTDSAPGTTTKDEARIGWRRQLLSLLLWVTVALLLRTWVIEPRWIPSGSMLPGLQLQDRILVEKLRPRLGGPLPIDTIVVFSPPEPLLRAGYDPGAALIKRVVGVAGDVIEVRQGQLLRNGEAVEEPWISAPMAYQLPPLTVPDDQLLVLGDNRNASLDSHLWGPLAMDHVIGTAVLRYWPLDRLGTLGISRSSPLKPAVTLR